jgi:hypothetical protein
MNVGFMPIGVMISRRLAKQALAQADGIGNLFLWFNIGIGIVRDVSQLFSGEQSSRFVSGDFWHRLHLVSQDLVQMDGRVGWVGAPGHSPL